MEKNKTETVSVRLSPEQKKAYTEAATGRNGAEFLDELLMNWKANNTQNVSQDFGKMFTAAKASTAKVLEIVSGVIASCDVLVEAERDEKKEVEKKLKAKTNECEELKKRMLKAEKSLAAAEIEANKLKKELEKSSNIEGMLTTLLEKKEILHS